MREPTVIFSLRIKKLVKDRLDEEAHKQNRDRSNLVEFVLAEYLGIKLPMRHSRSPKLVQERIPAYPQKPRAFNSRPIIKTSPETDSRREVAA